MSNRRENEEFWIQVNYWIANTWKKKHILNISESKPIYKNESVKDFIVGWKQKL